MKKIFSFIAILSLLLTSCEGFDMGSTGKVEDLFSQADLSKLDGYKAEGGVVKLPFTPSYDWEASANCYWIEVTPKSGSAGEEVNLKIELEENTTSSERNGIVTIKLSTGTSYDIPVRQLAGEGETLVVELADGARYEIEAEGGELEVMINTNVDKYDVYIPQSGREWLSHTDTRAMRSETIVFTATKNEEEVSRETTVTLSYKDNGEEVEVEFTVYQKAAQGETPTPTGPTIADVLAGEEGNYTIEGAWVVATYARGCLLTDASGAYILAFNPSETPAVGEVINISGSVTSYGGLKQFAAGATVTKTGETKEVVHPTAEVMDGAALDAYLDAPIVKYVEYEGSLVVNGNYFNITVAGAAKSQGAIQYPADDLKAQLTELNGKLIKVTGYLIGVASSKFTNTMAVSVVESENIAPETPKVTIVDITAAGSYKVDNAWVVATYASGCLLTDASGAYILAFKPSETPAVGEVINIDGAVSEYAGLLQFGQGAVVTKTGETKSITHPTAEVLDGAKMDAYLSAPEIKYVEYTGTLSISSGRYYNVVVPGAATAQGSVAYPGDELKAQLTGLDGKNIKVTGYLIGVSSSKYANTMAVSVAEVTDEPVTPPTPTGPTIADVLAGEEGNYTIEGAWVVATYARGCLLTDASGAYILAYNPATTPAVGDVITISGSVTTYAGLKQFAAGATVTVTGTTTVTHPTAEVMDGAALDAYLDAPIVKYVEYEGTLVVNGNYFNITVAGAAKSQGSIQYPADDLKAQLTELNGKLIKVTGYLIGVASSKFTNTMAVSVVESENIAPETPKETIADITAAGSYKVDNAWVVATYASGCLLTDASGAYILAFKPSETPAVGEVINIDGAVSEYAGLLQFGQGATVTKTGETKSVTHPTAEVLDGAKMDAYLSAPEIKYVEYTGTLSISSGRYYNVVVPGAATAQGSVAYPGDELKAQLTGLDGKDIKVTGYLIGVSSSKYANTMAVSVEEVASSGGSESNGTENFTPGNEQNPGWN